MAQIIARISSKNQVTLPAVVRRRLGIGASDKVAFVLDDDGVVELRPVKYDLEAIIGILKPLPNETVDLDREIEEAKDEVITRRMRDRT